MSAPSDLVARARALLWAHTDIDGEPSCSTIVTAPRDFWIMVDELAEALAVAGRRPMPQRRPSVTRKVVLPTAGGEHRFHVTLGRDPSDGRIVEAFYADGQKTGTELRASIEDACVLISLLLQRGVTLDEVSHSLGTVPILGEAAPASPVGAIVAVMRQEAAA